MSEDFKRPNAAPTEPGLPKPPAKKRGRPKKAESETVQIVILHHNQMTPDGKKYRGEKVTVPREFADTVLKADAEAEREPRIVVV